MHGVADTKRIRAVGGEYASNPPTHSRPELACEVGWKTEKAERGGAVSGPRTPLLLS